MKILKLTHEIDIDAEPHDLWNFFEKLETNYKRWHPEDHIFFKWVGGGSIKTGTKFHSQQIIMGRTVTYNGSIETCITNNLIKLVFDPPVSRFTEAITWELVEREKGCSFRAATYLYEKWWFKLLFRRVWNRMIQDHNRHVEQEALNLKKIMEG